MIDQFNEDLKKERDCATMVMNYTKSGKMFQNFVRVVPLRGSDDKVTHFFCVAKDMTGRLFEAKKRDPG